MRTGHLVLALVALSAMSLAACSQSESEQRQRSLKAAKSSAATARMAIGASLAGAVPEHYAQRALDRMREKLAQLTGQLASEDSPAAEAQMTSVLALARARAAMRRAVSAIEASDTSTLEQSREDIERAMSGVEGAPAER